jgi:hypothetical protein
MSRSSVRWGAAVAAIVGLGLLIPFAPGDAARAPVSPPASCGSAVSSWGGASANDVEVELLGVERSNARSPATPAATPGASASPTYFVELRIANHGDGPASIAVADVTLDLCDGTSLQPATVSDRTPLADGPIAAGATSTGWIGFALGEGEVPILLVVPISRPGLVGGRVEFPLVAADAGTPGSLGTTGSDAYGGDAVGAVTADGADATGAAGDAAQGS